MSGRILHFTLGPVQGFVAQARRTRDLWGGSFLLSWLFRHCHAPGSPRRRADCFPGRSR
ncbi:MAG: hypothetical protein M3461_01130 [Pseudomonadota bacterium]|nr:hypothetical protein [Pseudomonadota bacterium]